ncbi:MAG: DUF3131 domain-containing protein [Clostridia bacterium]|nr:DUF3131 domain-containing protein [Clostridia bacterium]
MRDITKALFTAAREAGELPITRGRRGFFALQREKRRMEATVRSLLGRGRAAIRRAERDCASVFDELLAADFYRLEKQIALLPEKGLHARGEKLPAMAAGLRSARLRVSALADSFAELCPEVTAGRAAAFIEEYQQRNPLSTAEIRLFPSALRIALLQKAAALLKKPGRDAAAELERLLAGLECVQTADFAETVEAADPARRLLAEDAVCRQMDAESIDGYLEAAARMGRRCGVSAAAVIRCSLSLAEKAGEGGKNAESRRTHAGYYLIAEGAAELQAVLRPEKARAADAEKRNKAVLAGFYAAKLAFAAGVSLAAGLIDENIFAALLSFFPAYAAAETLLIRIATRIKKPRLLPRLAPPYVRGDDCRTLVAVPVLISGEKALAEAVKTLERHYLANRLERAEYCVLGDFPDSETPEREGETELVEKAKALIAALNERCPSENGARFHYFHRARRFNKADGLYMGRERKRGAVEDLMAYIAEGDRGDFCCLAPEAAGKFRYLAVLDADTVMPNGALARLIGAAAHPLNRPVYRVENAKKPYSGYNIIVPRMASTSRSAAKSRFAMLISGESGMSAYSSEVSDFYFDLFGSGSFGGKGIIDIEGFRRASSGLIEENTVLSHDLLEGSLAGAAFAGSTVLYDGEPSSYLGYQGRRHRWLRGDTQLLGYVFGKKRRAVDPVSRRKMLMNVFGGLVPGAAYLALTNSVVFGFGAAFVAALVCFFIEPAAGFIADLPRILTGKRVAARPRVIMLRRKLTELAVLPFAALKDADAIVRALWRMTVSHKKMLEWRTAADGEKKGKAEYLKLWPCPAAGLSLAASAVFRLASPEPLLVSALVLAALFFAAPLAVMRLDGRKKPYSPNGEEKELLLAAAERTWRFFEENCTEKTHFLPPDNFQQEPLRGIAPLTSPTNIGMALAAAVCAKDLGFIDADGLLLRLDRTVSTIERLEKWRGLPFNWYSTADLSLPKPRFVSSVDCGNLFCCLVTAAAAVSGIEAEELGRFGPEFKEELARRMNAVAEGMDLAALYDAPKRLFYIGLDYENGKLTPAHYDLWASEARILSFVSVAWERVGARHWFTLGRLACDVPGGRCLKSWSGTAFEYLMPLIFFDTAEGSLQKEVSRSAVLTQILASRGEVWGVSESGYYAFDEQLRYQYRAFGTPALALSRESEKQDVIAPYASALALAVEPKLAVRNLRKLAELGMFGEYGFFEALDRTKSRVGGEGARVVGSFMAHHQGMILCSVANLLTDGAFRRRFMELPNTAANEQLLFENMPADPIRVGAFHPSLRRPAARRNLPPVAAEEGEMLCGVISEREYSVFMTADGRGVSRSGDILLTRYRRDSFAESGIEFAVAVGRTRRKIGGEMTAQMHKLSFRERIGPLEASLGVILPGVNCELRTLELVNCGRSEEVCTVGAFAEIALAPEAEDRAHPAFVRVTVDSEKVGETLLFTARKRPGRAEKTAFFHFIAPGGTELCCDGLVRPGRGGDILACLDKRAAENSAGELPTEQPVEPYYSAVTELRLVPGESARVRLLCGIAGSREEALTAVKNQLPRLAGSGIEPVARARAAQRFREAGVARREFALASLLAYRLLTGTPAGNKARGPRERGQASAGKGGLWRFGISPDLPTVAAEVNFAEELAGAALIVRALDWIVSAGQKTQLVIIGGYENRYGEPLRAALEGIVSGKAFARLVHGFEAERSERELILGCALVRLDPAAPFAALTEDAKRRKDEKTNRKTEEMKTFPPEEGEKPEFFNGFGGFDARRGEYRIILPAGRKTPLPWSNAIGGRRIGTLVTESGGGYTFAGNARLARLTPWTNDALRDGRGERLALTDAGSGERIALPPENGAYECAHGCGYTRFSFKTAELRVSLTETVDAELPLKYYRLEAENTGKTKKELAFELRIDPILGEYLRRETKRCRAAENAVFIRDILWEKGEEAFIAAAPGERLLPAEEGELTSPCVWTPLAVPSGKKADAVLLLGCAAEDEAEKIIASADYRGAMRSARAFRREKLESLVFRTGRPRFDTLLNGPLLCQLYQARLMTRTGFYQSGGATGFRDQLQDVSALLMTDPASAKRQLLVCAAKQFPEGDVLHWWHEDGRGVRTRIGDDRLFLPLIACEYLRVTGDLSLLSEEAPFLESRPIPPGRRDLYDFFPEEGSESFLGHCLRAAELPFRDIGAHGLPLMGSGDWNDGMDAVGDGGGESTVTAFLAVMAAEGLAKFLREMRKAEIAEELVQKAAVMRENIERNCWDGEKYTRAFYGDGSKLDVFDCVTACFAVFSGAEHGREAFENTLAVLEDGEHALVKLLAPPFGGAGRSAGYIEGYLPGVRENGGQYTHAAAWCVIAACKLGLAETAERLFDELNPLSHSDEAGIGTYKTEPYAVCGDVYSIGRLAGRGGWSLYTGAAGWLYRAAVEHILGLGKHGDILEIRPCTTLDEFSFEYRFGENGRTLYRVRAVRGGAGEAIKLTDDGEVHEITTGY